MSDLDLQILLGFNEEDLNANRDCRLSTGQQEQIERSEHLHKRLLVGAGILLTLIVVVNAYLVLSGAIKEVSSFATVTQNQFYGLMLGLGIPTLFLGFFAWSAFQYALNKTDHSVQQVRGRVNFIKVEKAFSEKKPNGFIFYRIVEVYEIRIGRVQFENVNQNLMDVIQAADIYAFYYTKDPQIILSAERLTKGK